MVIFVSFSILFYADSLVEIDAMELFNRVVNENTMIVASLGSIRLAEINADEPDSQ
jgi:hypothetical protein